jgi:hypothetical protein
MNKWFLPAWFSFRGKRIASQNVQYTVRTRNTVCTGAFLYVPYTYSFLLISNKFCALERGAWGGGGELDAISQGSKKSRFLGPNPLPHPLVNRNGSAPHQKQHYIRGRINHRCINN